MMEQYVDYKWYMYNFLMGKDPVIPEQLFDYYATQASAEVKRHVDLNADLSDPIDEVKAATCNVAEILCAADGNSVGTDDDETVSVPEGVTSEKVGEYSVSYAGNTATEKAAAKKAQIRSVVQNWLGPTGLLFRGV